MIPRIKHFLLFASLWIAAAVQHAAAQTHHLYVAAESEDKVYQISFDAQTRETAVRDVITVGQYPTENEGPHGINIGLNGKYWYLSIAHGNPYGWLYKFRTGTNEFIARTELGMFPASLEASAATGLLYVVNFNLHGDMEPSMVSVVDPGAMTVVAEITTGIMPHGSRISCDGRHQYHVSMMTDELIEVNTAAMKISRRLSVTPPRSRTAPSGPSETPVKSPAAKPTWADPHPAAKLVYVANNKSNEVVEVDTDSWSVRRRFKTGSGPYNLEVSPNGKWMVVSYKGEGSTGVWNLQTGREAAKIANSRSIPHGVTISPDSRYAFVSVEGIGGEAGSVDVIDLEQMERVAVLEVGKQAGGIIYWKTTD
ncbi:YncE family protein [Fodinibius sediminis]|uniref:DNA-binding beta-propeller fold protein YncE n=1 Tax=Fodinibius sediminis TaxID=1214077 RepID=A0A521BWI5_9BACT|nr:YncE family protein [Fodinibius sediminis]SMO51506.1 DNA-binding beta-propeller fold protein YncE [Fodinibius sediminis]